MGLEEKEEVCLEASPYFLLTSGGGSLQAGTKQLCRQCTFGFCKAFNGGVQVRTVDAWSLWRGSNFTLGIFFQIFPLNGSSVWNLVCRVVMQERFPVNYRFILLLINTNFKKLFMTVAEDAGFPLIILAKNIRMNFYFHSLKSCTGGKPSPSRIMSVLLRSGQRETNRTCQLHWSGLSASWFIRPCDFSLFLSINANSSKLPPGPGMATCPQAGLGHARSSRSLCRIDPAAGALLTSQLSQEALQLRKPDVFSKQLFACILKMSQWGFLNCFWKKKNNKKKCFCDRLTITAGCGWELLLSFTDVWLHRLCQKKKKKNWWLELRLENNSQPFVVVAMLRAFPIGGGLYWDVTNSAVAMSFFNFWNNFTPPADLWKLQLQPLGLEV